MKRREVYEVKQCTNRLDNPLISIGCHQSQEDLFHLLVFSSCPLRNTRDSGFEMTEMVLKSFLDACNSLSESAGHVMESHERILDDETGEFELVTSYLCLC